MTVSKRLLQAPMLVLLICMPLRAQQPQLSDSTGRDNEPKLSFVHVSAGFALAVYSGDIKERSDIFKTARENSVYDRRIALDILSSYRPITEKTMVGLNFSVLFDLDTVGDDIGDNFVVFSPSATMSALHFLSNRNREGFFLRADLGASYLYYRSSLEESERFGFLEVEDGEEQKYTAVGICGLAGLGFAIPVGINTRLSLQANYMMRQFFSDRGTIGNFSLSLGVLF